MPKQKPIMEAVRANMNSSLYRLNNLKRNDPDIKKADAIEVHLHKVLAILDGKELPPEPEPFVCRYPAAPPAGGDAGDEPVSFRDDTGSDDAGGGPGVSGNSGGSSAEDKGIPF